MLRNHLRVNFGKIDQTGWNVDTDVDSWAISYIAYHPVLELMRVVFRSRKYVMYEYTAVNVDMANEFFSATEPRRKTHIPRARSLGASFWKYIRLKRVPYTRKVLEDVAAPNLRSGRLRPDR
jgi:hypothetical protein